MRYLHRILQLNRSLCAFILLGSLVALVLLYRGFLSEDVRPEPDISSGGTGVVVSLNDEEKDEEIDKKFDAEEERKVLMNKIDEEEHKAQRKMQPNYEPPEDEFSTTEILLKEPESPDFGSDKRAENSAKKAEDRVEKAEDPAEKSEATVEIQDFVPGEKAKATVETRE